MITRAAVVLHAVRRLLSRSEWMVRLFRLPRATESPMAPGLIMVQIDGLSRAQFERALAAGEMPFLKRLATQYGYRTHTLYSGLPSTTPAVQGELFYGVQTAVPAFCYRDSRSGQVVRMYEPRPAANVEDALQQHGMPLLKGGSAYLDVFTGGAEESHFCPASLGWGGVIRGANPAVLAVLLLSNAFSLLRTAVLLILELFLAAGDFAHGLIEGRDFVKELKFVPTRVAICILLRELVTIGAKLDIARYLPIIHLNFLGYDEQAHRRGPSSFFAHWALKGIDDSIARIWRAAERSQLREYELWVYADHGQADVDSYAKTHGRSVGAAVADVFAEFRNRCNAPLPEDAHGIETQRVRNLGGQSFQRLFPVYPAVLAERDATEVTVTALGPLGLVYLPHPLAPHDRHRLAAALVAKAEIPMVLASEADGEALVWTSAGRFRLPQDRRTVFGENHPFLDEVTADMLKLCQHVDAGDFVISGARPNGRTVTFPIENGSHGGPGIDETRAFALLPKHVQLPQRGVAPIRPVDLRKAALRHLGRAGTEPAENPRGRRRRTLRVMTYNVHSCIGMDRRSSPERIARVIAQYEPDVVALQELDVGRPRTGRADQAHLIARHLEMAYHFHPTIQLEEEHYGNAILSRLPMRLVKAGKLPGLAFWPRREPRGAIWATVEVDGLELQVINTHLGLRRRERIAQAEALSGEDWLGHPECRGPRILIGDLNAGPGSRALRRLTVDLNDAQLSVPDHQPAKTWFGPYPTVRIDHVLVDPGIAVRHVEVPKTGLARLASDHLPLVVDLDLEGLS
ncbi:MAG: endonuclease/exonuclease/phosphatase family protein [Minwuiales bacterium]|nr:endonuclease/exonuclease/phosphatase family protein [Minwuiales bacterium]